MASVNGLTPPENIGDEKGQPVASVVRVERGETWGSALWLTSPSPDFASLHPGYLLSRIKKCPHFPHLSGKDRIMAALSQLPRPRTKQTAEKNRVGSEGSLAAAECLEFAPGGELKKIKLAHQGALREAICGVE